MVIQHFKLILYQMLLIQCVSSILYLVLVYCCILFIVHCFSSVFVSFVKKCYIAFVACDGLRKSNPFRFVPFPCPIRPLLTLQSSVQFNSVQLSFYIALNSHIFSLSLSFPPIIFILLYLLIQTLYRVIKDASCMFISYS